MSMRPQQPSAISTPLPRLNLIRQQTLSWFQGAGSLSLREARSLMDRLMTVPDVLDIACARSLVRDLQRCAAGHGFSLRETRHYFNNPGSDTLISLLSAPYAKPMGLEYLKFELLPVDPALKKYATNVMPIVVRESTEGLEPVHTVAIFPENHVGAVQEAGDKIYYLINKFAHRHHQLTQRIIEHLTTETSFGRIRGADYLATEQATVYWVWMHEYHHQRVGDLPIPTYLTLKSSRPLAGLEELRVDIASALALLDDPAPFHTDTGQLFEFILAERLLRYGVDGVRFDADGQAWPSYDALSSYMLFNLLRRRGALEVIDGKIHLTASLVPTLRAILREILALESLIRESPVERVKEALMDFVHEALEVSGPIRHYAHRHYDHMRVTLTRLKVPLAMA